MSDPRRNFAAGAAASSIERWALPLVDGNVIGRPIDEAKAKAAIGFQHANARFQSDPVDIVRRNHAARVAKPRDAIDRGRKLICTPLQALLQLSPEIPPHRVPPTSG